MFEHYTQRARRTVFFARYEASVFRSEYIDTEHLLLGILREDHRLRNELPSGAEDAIRKRIQELKPPGGPAASTNVDLPLSEDAERVLTLAAEESSSLQHKVIDSDHLILCLLHVENCLAATLLRENGLDYARYRAVVAKLPPPDNPPGFQSLQRSPGPAMERPSAWHQLEAVEPLAPSLKVHVRALQNLVDGTREPEAYARERLKAYRYDAGSGVLTFSEAQTEAFNKLALHYGDFFGTPDTRNGLRSSAISDPPLPSCYIARVVCFWLLSFY